MKKWLGFLAMIPVQGMIFMDQTVLPVALPTIQKEFGAGSVALEWTINSYLLLTAMFALFGGKFADRIGHRPTLFWGLLLFALASLFSGLSPNVGSLIAARALQGFSAALMIPPISGLFASLFPESQRGRATGLLVSIGSLFMILGPLAGGYLTEEISWRWIFWLNLPFCAIAYLLGKAFLPNPAPGRGKIDLWGLASFALCAGSLITCITESRQWGWTSLPTLSLALLTLLSLTLLIYREKTTAHPFLDLALFKRPVYAAINVSITIVQFALMISIFRAIYFQTILGYTPSEAGMITFISTLPVLFFAVIAGYLADTISPKLPIILGYLLLISSFFWLAFHSTPNLATLFVALIGFGMGIPMIFTPSFSSAMKAVPPKKLGIAFGTIATLRTLAATLGVALIGLFIETSKTKALALHNNLREAEIHSFSTVHFALGCLMIGASIVSLLLHQRKTTHPLPDSPAEGWD